MNQRTLNAFRYKVMILTILITVEALQPSRFCLSLILDLVSVLYMDSEKEAFRFFFCLAEKKEIYKASLMI